MQHWNAWVYRCMKFFAMGHNQQLLIILIIRVALLVIRCAVMRVILLLLYFFIFHVYDTPTVVFIFTCVQCTCGTCSSIKYLYWSRWRNGTTFRCLHSHVQLLLEIQTWRWSSCGLKHWHTTVMNKIVIIKLECTCALPPPVTLRVFVKWRSISLTLEVWSRNSNCTSYCGRQNAWS